MTPSTIVSGYRRRLSVSSAPSAVQFSYGVLSIPAPLAGLVPSAAGAAPRLFASGAKISYLYL